MSNDRDRPAMGSAIALALLKACGLDTRNVIDVKLITPNGDIAKLEVTYFVPELVSGLLTQELSQYELVLKPPSPPAQLVAEVQT